jgi:photosystem II stability/assembly factor-like uncharacterized protein
MRRPLLILTLLCLGASLHAQWMAVGSGISATPRGIQSLAALDANTLWAVTNDPTFTVAAREFTRTTNGGLTWDTGVIDAANGDSYTSISVFALDANTAWVTMADLDFGTFSTGRIYKTTNGGQSWQQQSGTFNNVDKAPTAVHFFDANVGVAYGSPATGFDAVDVLRIWRTTNGGDTWMELTDVPATQSGEAIFTYFGNDTYAAIGDNLWFGTRRGRIWHSDDRGATWETQSVGANVPIYAVAFKDALNGMAVSDGLGFVTTDGGDTWSAISIPDALATYQVSYVPDTPGTYVLVYEGSNDFFADFRVAYTLNDGLDWTTTDATGIEVVQFLSPTVGWGGGQIFGTTSGGLYEWTGDLDAVTSISEAKTGFGQVKVFPNPFAAETAIEFEVENSQSVEFIIRDVTNKIVSRTQLENLASGRQQHRIGFDAPAGMYLLTIRQAEKTHTVKLFKQ